MISRNITENNRGRHFKLSYVFTMSEVCVHLYVCHFSSLEWTKNFWLQYSLRYSSGIETVVIVIGIF